VVDRQEASDASEPVAFKIELEGLLASLVVVTERKWLRGVLGAACLTLQELAAGTVKA
jgi:hypothetical protein